MVNTMKGYESVPVLLALGRCCSRLGVRRLLFPYQIDRESRGRSFYNFNKRRIHYVWLRYDRATYFPRHRDASLWQRETSDSHA